MLPKEATAVEHPKMFEDDDPVLARVRRIALTFPEAAEKVSHGRPAFYTRKVFAYYGGSQKVDGEWLQHPTAVMVLADLDGQSALRALPDSWVPAYLGPYGWTGLDLGARTDWDDVAGFIEESYRFTANARLVNVLDESWGTS
jgi:YjbR